jgi:hypothetical protein
MSGEFEMEGLAEGCIKILQYVLENKLCRCEQNLSLLFYAPVLNL